MTTKVHRLIGLDSCPQTRCSLAFQDCWRVDHLRTKKPVVTKYSKCIVRVTHTIINSETAAVNLWLRCDKSLAEKSVVLQTFKLGR